MASKTILIVAAVAVVAVVAVGAFLMMGGGSNDDESYYFYINYGDNDDKTGWYTATGKNVDDALVASVKDKGITVNYGKSGYPNFDDGTWGVYSYNWSLCSTVTAEQSVSSANYGAWDNFIKSNGWDAFSGYGDGAKKLDQSSSNVYYFAKYDPTTYAIVDPTQCELWATATGSPFAKGVDFAKETTFYFYVYFGDNDAKTGWYSAKASNADVALAAAVKDKLTLSYSHGYPNFGDGTWGVFNYDWSQTTSVAAENSISSPEYGAWADFIKSNGWDSFSGYGDGEKKLFQSASNVFFFSMYDPTTYAIVDPTQCELWATATGSPFSA